MDNQQKKLSEDHGRVESKIESNIESNTSFSIQIVNNNMVLKFLQSLGLSYTTEELLESELAILKALHFQINVPVPFAYVEMLLEVLGKAQKLGLLLAKLYYVGLKITHNGLWAMATLPRAM